MAKVDAAISEGLQNGELKYCFARWLWNNVLKEEYMKHEKDFVFVGFGCSCGLFCAYLSLMMPSNSKIIGIEICELRTIHFRRFMKIVECLPFKHSKLELLYGDGLKYGGNDLVI